MSSSSDESRAIDLYCPVCGPVDIAVIVGAAYRMQTEVWREACNIVVVSDGFAAPVHTCGTFEVDEPPPWIADPPYRVTTTCALCAAEIGEVHRYVAAPVRADYIKGATVAICDGCISAGHQAIVADRGEDSFVQLPMRVIGPVPDADAPGAIVSAFRGVFGSNDADVITAMLEDGHRFQEPIRETLARLPSGWPTFGVRVDRIHFLSALDAETDFAHTAPGGGTIVTYNGHAIFRDGRWRVTADTFTQVSNISPLPPQ